jgi:hypothetical protein
MVLFGAQGLGSLIAGAIAEALGVRFAFLIAGAGMAAGLVTIRVWPLIETTGMDRRAIAYWPEPALVFEAQPDSGPVVVKNVYTVAAEREQAFIEAMKRVRLSRLRTGGTQWGLFRDGEVPHQFVEL